MTLLGAMTLLYTMTIQPITKEWLEKAVDLLQMVYPELSRQFLFTKIHEVI